MQHERVWDAGRDCLSRRTASRMASSEWIMKENQPKPVSTEPLRKLSVIIPARNEEGCIASTVEHLHVELRLHGIDHEIIVVDDGSTGRTWGVLATTSARVPTLSAVRNTGRHGFGCAVTLGFDHMSGDAAIIMMADES